MPEGGVVGYSVWPHDAVYRPLVGLFDGMDLVAHAACDLQRPGKSRLPSRLLVGIARRLGVAQRLLVPVPLEGPSQDYWFNFDPGSALCDRLRRGDSALRLGRLEDGVGLANARARETAPAAARTVEQLLQLPDSALPSGLDGFPFLLEAPYEHQLDVLYLDILGRAPDDNAYRDYLPQLESGAWSLVDLRRILLSSQEFHSRRLTSNDRIGVFMTSRLWVSLSQAQAPGDPRRPAPRAVAGVQEPA